MKEVLKIIDTFYGGIQKDDRSNIIGSLFNAEEVDIFTNKDYIQPETILTSDTLPTSSELYAYTIGPDDTLYGYGKRTDSSNQVRIFSLSNASSTGGSWTTLFTSTSTDAAKQNGIILWHEVTETTQKQYLYYIAGTNTLKRYGPLYSSPSESTVGTLTGLSASTDKIWGFRLFGELYIGHGQYIAHVDKNGTFTEKKFTLPNSWKGVDAVGLSDTMLILCENVNSKLNYSMVYQWDLVSTTQFDDSLTIPMGGPQWIVNHKENIRICCIQNGTAKFYQLSGSYPIETHTLTGIGSETSGLAPSPAKSKAVKEGILYFGLKGNKSGIYAIGQAGEQKPIALVLSKRFNTTDYSKHSPIALFVAGQNFYVSYNDNSTKKIAKSSTTRSSNAVIETTWEDFNAPLLDKDLSKLYVFTDPLSSNTSLTVSVASDYDSSYSEVKEYDGTTYSTTGQQLGIFNTASFVNKKAFKVKVAFTSSGTSAIKLRAIGLRVIFKDYQ